MMVNNQSILGSKSQLNLSGYIQLEKVRDKRNRNTDRNINIDWNENKTS